MKSIRTAALGLLVLVFTAGSACASESSKLAGNQAHWLHFEKSGIEERAKVSVSVSIFVRIPSQRLIFHDSLLLPAGSTASQAAEAVYKVEHGLVCCDARDVKSINGLAVDPYKEKWWILIINGNRQNVSSRTIINDGDVIEWIYDEKTGYEPAHVRLEDWVEMRNKK